MIIKPDYLYDCIETIEIKMLIDLNITTLFVDVDNTLTKPKHKQLSDEKKQWLQQVTNQGIRIFLISNNTGDHIKHLARLVNLPAFEFACKPFSFVYKKMQKEHHLHAREIGVIGDQLFTDIVGGNLRGYTTFYVTPISKKDMIFTWLPRKIEGKLLAWWK